MKLRRFRVQRENILGREAFIAERGEINHISRVLRLSVGDAVILFDGEGKEYQASITSISPRKVFLKLLGEPALTAAESPLKIILGAGVLKPHRFEWLLQKATELGVSEILPFFSLHVVPRWEEGANQTRQARWERIAAEAAKQCGRPRLPVIHAPRSFAEILASEFRGATKIFLWEKERTGTLQEALGKPTSIVFALVGPEGSFSEKEATQAQEAGFHPIRLGPRILRAETAGVVIVSLLQFLLGDWQ